MTPDVTNPSSLAGKRGIELLHDPDLNKSTAFTEDERDAYGLTGAIST
jgi:malate dehydrogenase (oxaloacetate-decarboxylating)(NADP+)